MYEQICFNTDMNWENVSTDKKNVTKEKFKLTISKVCTFLTVRGKFIYLPGILPE